MPPFGPPYPLNFHCPLWRVWILSGELHIKLWVTFNFKHKYTGKISESKLTILEETVKGYHKCSFPFGVDDKKKRGERDPTLKVADDGSGRQLGLYSVN